MFLGWGADIANVIYQTASNKPSCAGEGFAGAHDTSTTVTPVVKHHRDLHLGQY